MVGIKCLTGISLRKGGIAQQAISDSLPNNSAATRKSIVPGGTVFRP